MLRAARCRPVRMGWLVGVSEGLGRVQRRLERQYQWPRGMELLISVEKFDCVRGAFSLCGIGEYGIATIVFHGWSEVPSFDCMWIPRATLGWFFMDDDFGAGRYHWCFVKIESAF